MASPSTVITLGFGSWGGVNLLPTLGYGIGEDVVQEPGCVHGTDAARWSVNGSDAARWRVQGSDAARWAVNGTDEGC
jgi:hypothetical protein